MANSPGHYLYTVHRYGWIIALPDCLMIFFFPPIWSFFSYLVFLTSEKFILAGWSILSNITWSVINHKSCPAFFSIFSYSEMAEVYPKVIKVAWLISTKNLPYRPDPLKKSISTKPLNYYSAFTIASPAVPRDLGKLWHFFLCPFRESQAWMDLHLPRFIHGCLGAGDPADCSQLACNGARFIS